MIFSRFLAPLYSQSLYAQFNIIVIQIGDRLSTESVEKSSTKMDSELLARELFHNEKSMNLPGRLRGRTSGGSFLGSFSGGGVG